jgi:methionyl-tRNA formyltransferase
LRPSAIALAAIIATTTSTSLMIQQMDDYYTFDAGNVVLQSGMTLRGAKLVVSR